MEGIKQAIGSQIRTMRKLKGLTQKELGAKIGVSESQVNRYESGNLNMSVETLYKIADSMDLDLSIILKIR